MQDYFQCKGFGVVKEEIIMKNWIVFDDIKPENYERVLVIFKNQQGHVWQTKATYIEYRKVLAGDYLSEEAWDCGFLDRDEENDCDWA